MATESVGCLAAEPIEQAYQQNWPKQLASVPAIHDSLRTFLLNFSNFLNILNSLKSVPPP
ncbi:hypothetical protein MRBBS_2362 [Marinobacter sp. BSs20148]|nr:hypothetical protein MRBBS_2362 [Marinobacter sp. BSs20148]